MDQNIFKQDSLELYIKLKKEIFSFIKVYKNKPFCVNKGGMRSGHMFALWFTIRNLKPKIIVESGVWKGYSTWLIDKAAPDAKIICLEPNLNNIEYKSKNAFYSKKDFSSYNWSNIKKKKSLLFFDDHQNAIERVKLASHIGFKDIIFDDNYPIRRGDCLSLKKILMKGKKRLKFLNKNFNVIKKNIEVYYEFPPIYVCERTRWGDLWDSKKYPTKKALFNEDIKELSIFKKEAKYYTWICYVKLK